MATAGTLPGLAEPDVDHLAHTPALLATEVRGLRRFDAAGAAISDHAGVVVDLARVDGKAA